MSYQFIAARKKVKRNILKMRNEMNKHTTKTEEKVFSYIKSNHMFDSCRHIVVGVSGGADSVCLLLMLCDYVKIYQPDIRIHVVHVNHMIRQEAADDENFTKKLCESVGVDYHVEYIDCVGIAKQHNLTVEEAGRLERYRIFNDMAEKYSADGHAVIAVAHHMNDQAETVLMNMARGTSLKGVRGIVPVRDNICRPLLCITRKQIEDFLSQADQEYVTDITNYDNDYTRNAIRNVILPYMCGHINKRAVENISSMAQDIREAEEYIDRQADKLYTECVHEYDCKHNKIYTNDHSTDKRDVSSDIIKIEVAGLKEADRILVKRVIYKCLVSLAGRAKDIYSVNISDIASLIDMQTGRKICSVYGIMAEKEYDYITLKKSTMAAVKKKNEKDINISDARNDYKKDSSSDGSEYNIAVNMDVLTKQNNLTLPVEKNIYITKDGEKYAESITFSLIDKKTFLINDKSAADNGKICVNKSNNIYAKYYDYDKINKLLDVRFRKQQDDIVVSKDGSTKKLKKELVDKKIPSAYRDEILLVCDKNHVLWACGVRRCESYLVDDDTSHVLEILINVKERN